jgi:hypothetical protein
VGDRRGPLGGFLGTGPFGAGDSNRALADSRESAVTGGVSIPASHDDALTEIDPELFKSFVVTDSAIDAFTVPGGVVRRECLRRASR